jgi:hypothetical protein
MSRLIHSPSYKHKKIPKQFIYLTRLNFQSLKDNLINDWQCETTANVGEGEQLVSVSWIDNGIKVIL